MSGGGDGDVCALLGTEDLAAAAGGSWGEPLDASEPGQYFKCIYSLVGEVVGSSDLSASLDVTVYHEEHLAGVGGVQATFDTYVSNPGVVEVDTGDGAFYDATLAPIWQVYMLAGGAVVTIVGFSFTPEVVFDQESATTIAGIIADNV